IFLKEEIDFQRLIREFQARLDAHQPGDGKFSLTAREIVEFLLAPLAMTPRAPEPLFEDYLELAVKLATKAEDPGLISRAYLATTTRPHALAPETDEKFRRIALMMDPNYYSLADVVTDGQFSAFQVKIKAMEEAAKAKDKATKAKEEEAKAREKALREAAKAKEKALREAAKAKDAENERLKTGAVLALRAKNMGMEEISAELKLSLTDVAKVLDNAKKKGQ
ncbi:MAG: hypothetical protein LBO66_03075, partial [Deltaproteobacteria bacterium]|nr:hypothetical protein [Deltaproteobacteria bacterium]